MKKIALFVVLAYAVLLVVLTWPVIVVGLHPQIKPTQALEVFKSWGYWVFIGMLVLCQAGLLLLPVKITSRRPITRKHVFLPIIVSGLLIGALCFGVICALNEWIQKDKVFDSRNGLGAAIACCITIWMAWSIAFSRLTCAKDPQSVVMKQCKRLLQGGVIALLVAVPTHIVARSREYCCAGFHTFVGITFGIAVMLISFGPGIYFLYAERWRRLHPSKPDAQKTAVD